jgi:hypothetical protein
VAAEQEEERGARVLGEPRSGRKKVGKRGGEQVRICLRREQVGAVVEVTPPAC